MGYVSAVLLSLCTFVFSVFLTDGMASGRPAHALVWIGGIAVWLLSVHCAFQLLPKLSWSDRPHLTMFVGSAYLVIATLQLAAVLWILDDLAERSSERGHPGFPLAAWFVACPALCVSLTAALAVLVEPRRWQVWLSSAIVAALTFAATASLVCGTAKTGSGMAGWVFVPIALVYVGRYIVLLQDRRQSVTAAEAAARRVYEQGRVQSQLRAAEAARRDVTTREHVRYQCETAFSLHAADIKERFPRSDYDAFMQKFMTDALPLSEFEKRGKQLEEIILQHARVAAPHQHSAPKDLERLTRWYLDQKKLIEASPVAAEVKETQRVVLEQRYAELSERCLESQVP